MSALFTGEEIMEITGGRMAAGLSRDEAGAICTDSRSVKEGDWYLALVGERFDGHDFLGDAFSAGAIGAIVEERTGYAIGNQQFPLIAVDNTLDAYHALARNWRKRINPFVVGVTGSSGKTTTKEMCAAVFSAAMRCHKSAQNENNEIGVAKTILSMPDDTQVLIIEMAMRGLKQIDQLARCAVPDVGIITNAGTAHLELLGTLENIAIAKAEILAHLTKNRGVGIIGEPTERLLKAARAVFTGTLLTCEQESVNVDAVTERTTQFHIDGLEEQFEVQAHGRPLLEDAWCAIMAAKQRGLDPEVIAVGLRSFEAIGGRGNRLVGIHGALVLDETYNANPDSVKASVSALLDGRAFPHSNKIIVLGELAELGPTETDLHRQLGVWLKDKPVQTLITVGRLARNIAEGAQGASYEVLPCLDQAEAEKALRSRLSKDSCVLIKGSHRANLDRLVAILT
jgi:UDP-N-acetylmuramoyl-tripeptide--D-alanyl-D-alanine ligase